MFKPIPFEAFERFHQEFQGDTWDTCERCGGKCEINKIGSLMPGEAAYISKKRGETEDDFRAKYLDGIQTDLGLVDVLKLKQGCPFLDSQYRCTIKEVKVVLCEVYPVVFEVEGDDVKFYNDDWCPIVRHVPQVAADFHDVGIPAIRRLNVQPSWFEAVSLYDHLCVDYTKFEEIRRQDLNYRIFTMDEVRACQSEDSPPPELAPPSNFIPIEHLDPRKPSK
jgi:uncharacterized protein